MPRIRLSAYPLMILVPETLLTRCWHCEPPRARTQLSHFGMILGSLWDDFGVTLGSFVITLG